MLHVVRMSDRSYVGSEEWESVLKCRFSAAAMTRFCLHGLFD